MKAGPRAAGQDDSASHLMGRPNTDALQPIAAVQDALPPGAVFEIPVNRLLESRRKRLLRPPAERALDLAGIDRVAAVVPGAILYERDQGLEAVTRLTWRGRGVENAANLPNDIYVALLVVPADVVGLARPARP